ncbi:hypothetical protein LTR17_007475 [Elasticomyces elasticus]|nr:hypothetical protein LTR17_007475 [Elasticomyces elasticus]
MVPPHPNVSWDAFAQAWLFFGLLTETLRVSDVEITTEDFVRYADGREFVTTALLPKYLNLWRESESKFCAETQKDHLDAVCLLLDKADKVVAANFGQSFVGSQQDESTGMLQHLVTRRGSSISPNISLSIMVLGETLADAAKYVWGAVLPSFFTSQLYDFTTKRLRDRHWCESEIQMLHSGMLPGTTPSYLATMIDRPFMATNHETCSRARCQSSFLDESSYRTRHECNGDRCNLLAVNIEEVSEIICQGGTPSIVISAVDNESGELERNISLEVLNRRPTIAISHVWSHGLGNPTKNALPACQLLRLLSLMSHLDSDQSGRVQEFYGRCKYTSPPFWIDTLSIPVQEQFCQSRKLAIASLPSLFSSCKFVLVLDTELENATACATRSELCLRILLSGWMKRLWTLQEGVLGRHALWFQFRERAIPLAEIIEEVDNSPCHPFNRIRQTVLARLPLHTLLSQKNVLGLKLLPAALFHRATSKLEDEPVCIAGLLGANLGKILEMSDSSSRMKALLIEIGKLPQGILFLAGPKLEKENFRWAPTSLLVDQIEDAGLLLPSLNRDLIECDANGIHGTFKWLKVEHDVMRLRSDWIILMEQTDGTQFLVQPRTRCTNHAKNIKNPAIIQSSTNKLFGALVEITFYTETSIRASFICAVQVITLEHHLPSSLRQNGYNVRKMADAHLWCIQ